MNRTTYTPSVYIFLLVGAIIVLIDQLSKAIIVSRLNVYDTRAVIPGFFNLTHITNTGAAFGFMAGADNWRHILFQTIALAALGVASSIYTRPFPKRPMPFFGAAP